MISNLDTDFYSHQHDCDQANDLEKLHRITPFDPAEAVSQRANRLPYLVSTFLYDNTVLKNLKAYSLINPAAGLKGRGSSSDLLQPCS